MSKAKVTHGFQWSKSGRWDFGDYYLDLMNRANEDQEGAASIYRPDPEHGRTRWMVKVLLRDHGRKKGGQPMVLTAFAKTAREAKMIGELMMNQAFDDWPSEFGEYADIWDARQEAERILKEESEAKREALQDRLSKRMQAQAERRIAEVAAS